MKVPILKDEKNIGFQNSFFKDLIQNGVLEKNTRRNSKTPRTDYSKIDTIKAQMTSRKIRIQ